MERDFPLTWAYYTGASRNEQSFFKLKWRAFAFIRIMDYLDHEGETFIDSKLHGQEVVSQPISLLRKALYDDPCEATVDFLDDILTDRFQELDTQNTQN
jgi:lysine 2,3-aminomutase